MMDIRRIARALQVALGILVKELTSMLGPFLIRLFGGIALVIAVIYGVIIWTDPQFFEKEDEEGVKLHAYAEKIKSVIPSLQESESFEPKSKIHNGIFVVWFFGEQAKYFSHTKVRPVLKEPGYVTHVGFGGVEFPSYQFNWGFPNRYLQKFYSDDFYWELAGFVGKLPWPDPRMAVLIKPVESGTAEKVYAISNTNGTKQTGHISLKRFGYKVWLYDLINRETVGYQSFSPDPWPDTVSFRTFTGRRGRGKALKDQEGNLLTQGDTNYIGSNRELFAWIRSISQQEGITIYFSDEERQGLP
jgi:hypothetical protein